MAKKKVANKKVETKKVETKKVETKKVEENKEQKKIESLTPEQQDKMAVYRDKWLAIGLNTDTSDIQRAEKAINALYVEAGLKVPQKFIWVDSPSEAQSVIHELSGSTDKTQKFDSDFFSGQHDAAWCGWVNYYDEVLGIDFKEEDRRRFTLFQEVAQSCNWWWPFENICVVSDRPKLVKMQNGVIHNEEGPAIEFRDGFKIWGLEGVRVTEKIVMAPETITPEEIQKETNAEIQRIMITRYGAGKYLTETKSKIVDMDNLSLEGSAARMLCEDSAGNKWLVGTDGSTKRVYHMSVPREAKTCVEAHNMISGFDESRLIAEC
jgi:hypothetical protein